ncbi:hypothetical protein MWU49_02615 [Alcanivorax sp. S6407]|uniref:PGPGW domain-containing protein n=1 Tax=Alcanivorax sp. S6407 TaxID=2926424 RepID=UPI001FF525E5|nr:PGPGW domain-containing protein [Alcanivorax sp. S6407]MCK0152585.1 hypothetical protein [Alcanivorax sp. S6407]
MTPSLPDWLVPVADQLEPWLPALTLTGVVMAVASVVAIPLFIARMPSDYFTAEYHPLSHRHPLGWLLWCLRNLVALILLVAGIIMLVLPGQGLLTILIAIMTSTFPGKYRLERAIMRRPGVYRGANWIRRKYHRPPLQHPDDVFPAEDPDHGD